MPTEPIHATRARAPFAPSPQLRSCTTAICVRAQPHSSPSPCLPPLDLVVEAVAGGEGRMLLPGSTFSHPLLPGCDPSRQIRHPATMSQWRIQKQAVPWAN